MGNERMERNITIEEHVLYKEDYQMKMLKANSPEGFLKVAGRGMNGSSYYDYDVSGKISMQAMYTRAKLKGGGYTAIYVPVWECAEMKPENICWISTVFYWNRNIYFMRKGNSFSVIIRRQRRIYGRNSMC